MADAVQMCAYHRNTETRVACSTCGKPICPACMRPGPVGQKCPDCASQPLRARALGRPVHYIRAVGAGTLVAGVSGWLLAFVLRSFGFGTLILAALAGLAIGRTVLWGAQRQRQRPFPGIAAALAGLAVGLAFVLRFATPVPGAPLLLLAYGAAAYVAFATVSGGR